MEALVAAHRLPDCKLAAQDKDLAVDNQPGAAAEDTAGEEPSQAEEAIDRQTDNIG